MEAPLVTVVIPIYNVIKYLDRCMQSVVNQSYGHLDIIMVDDGSTDGCYELCDNWKAKDKRIRVIHKKNEGLGLARNTGIKNAYGSYICFFDSDDYIRLDAIETAVASAITNDSEIVIWGWGGYGMMSFTLLAFLVLKKVAFAVKKSRAIFYLT